MASRPNAAQSMSGLAPRGASGLKFAIPLHLLSAMSSRPTRGEWIEISDTSILLCHARSRPTRGEWIEICSTT